MTRKLKLDVETLAVETFATVGGKGSRGTVHGAELDLFVVAEDSPDTGCTAPCMSGASGCKLISCGSNCGTFTE